MERPYQICVRCVMDTTHPEITFDDDGVCNFCYEYHTVAKRALLPEDEARHELERIIQTLKVSGKGSDYDCLLGVSGGVDSSYLAYMLKEFGLRALAVQFDNGWNSELAVRNIELLCEKLDLDLYTYVVDWREFRDLQVAFLKASVANVEAPSDHGIFATLYRVADRHEIKYIINGNNIMTEQIQVPSYGYAYGDLKQLRGIHARFGKIKLKTFPQMGFFKRHYYEMVRGIRSISLLNYLPYNKSEAIRTLEQKLGWRYYGGKHFESIITRFHQSYILPTKFGLDKRKAHLSNLIFSGQITRAEALKELQAPPCAPTLIEEDLEYVIKKLGLTEAEFQEIMALPPKNYKDYPNEEWLYSAYAALGARVSRLKRRFSLRNSNLIPR